MIDQNIISILEARDLNAGYNSLSDIPHFSKMRDMKIDMSNIFKLLQEIKNEKVHQYFNKDFLLNLIDKIMKY